jgi:hypothetical protein
MRLEPWRRSRIVADFLQGFVCLAKVRRGETPQPARKMRALPGTISAAPILNPNMTSYLHWLRGGRVTCQRLVHDSHSSFCEEVLSCRPASAAARMRWSGQIFWLLVFGPEEFRGAPSSRLHRRPAVAGLTIGSWEVVSSYSSATAPGSHGISRADPLIKLAKNCRRSSGLRFCSQDLFVSFARLLRCGLETP